MRPRLDTKLGRVRVLGEGKGGVTGIVWIGEGIVCRLRASGNGRGGEGMKVRG